MSTSVWRYDRRHQEFICTAGGYTYPVSARQDCFCVWYNHLAEKAWATVEVLREFHALAAQTAPADWMMPDRSFRAYHPSLSHCAQCNAVVLLHALETCRYCGAAQPAQVRLRAAREEIYQQRFEERLAALAPAPSSGFHVVSGSAILLAGEEAEQSMEQDGIPRLVRD